MIIYPIICIYFSILFGLTISHNIKDFEDTVLYKIDWPGNSDTLFDSAKYEPMIVTTNDQEQYKCMIPQILNKEEENRSVDVNLSPLHFISPIFSSSTCSYRIEAYWTYEICHGHHVKQYHEEREGKNIKVQEYFLGKWDSDKMEKFTQKMKEDQESGRKFKYTKIDNVKYSYLEMEMSDGTLCDLNNEPRVTRVRYVCYPHGKNEIYTLKETSSCNYEAVILTSVLCMHPAFLPEDSDESVISCLPVDDSPEKPLSWLVNEIDNMKIRYKQISNVMKPKESIAIIKIDPKDGTLRMNFINSDSEDKVTSGSSEAVEIDEETPANNLPKVPNIRDTTPVLAFFEDCFTGGTGWWKYEFCYGHYLRQFHIHKSGETSLMLGFFDEGLHKEWLKKNPEKRPKPKNVRTDIVHFYQGGTPCDKTGESRQTEVKLKCLTNVSSPSTLSMYLLEPKTCQYILVFESPIICDFLQLADDDGLVPNPTVKGSRDAKSVESVYIGSIPVDDLEVRYEND